MDNSERGGVQKILLLLLFACMTNKRSHAASEDEYSLLVKSQGIPDESTDSRSKLVSSLSHLLEQEEEDKRSSAFFPLRGKKLSSSDPNFEDHYQFMPDHEDKRSQFFPLRGKKVPSDLKRASYFMPMRGRKDEGWDYSDEEDKQDSKRASSFMPMRGKKKINGASNIFQHFGKPGTYPNSKTDISFPSNSDYNRLQIKRMSSFIPMRGKKSSQNFESVTIEAKPLNVNQNATNQERVLNKRSISFTPIRGRRLQSYSGEQLENSENDSSEEVLPHLLDKKHFSFMPMRGRRASYFGESISDHSSDLNTQLHGSQEIDLDDPKLHVTEEQVGGLYKNHANEKRVSSFMAMRGRKQDQNLKSMESILPELNEEKRKSMFMPMRGRRGSSESSLDSPFSIGSEDKRAMGFIPMRGRRQALDSFNEFIADQISHSNTKTSSLRPISSSHGNRDSYDLNRLNGIVDQIKRLAIKPMSGRIFSNGISDENDKKAYGFMPMRGRRMPTNTSEGDQNADLHYDDKRGYAFIPMRGRRGGPEKDNSNFYFSPFQYFIPAGIGSALISRPFGRQNMFMNSIRAAAETKNRRQYDWESVKRAFHATRGKRSNSSNGSADYDSYSEDDNQRDRKNLESDMKNFRLKRSIFRQQVSYKPQRKYLALKRPMSFFATRGKRFDESSIDKISTLP